jgi:hypothetical protein
MLLRELGYEKGQGYLFARPGPREGLEDLLRDGGPWMRSIYGAGSSLPPRSAAAAA